MPTLPIWSAMPAKVETTPVLPGLSPVDGKPVVARFDGGHLSSDGGLVVLREVERRLTWPDGWRRASGTCATRIASCKGSTRSSAFAC